MRKRSPSRHLPVSPPGLYSLRCPSLTLLSVSHFFCLTLLCLTFLCLSSFGLISCCLASSSCRFVSFVQLASYCHNRCVASFCCTSFHSCRPRLATLDQRAIQPGRLGVFSAFGLCCRLWHPISPHLGSAADCGTPSPRIWALLPIVAPHLPASGGSAADCGIPPRISAGISLPQH